MQVPVRLSQESLFGFLISTRLPVVSSVTALVRWGSVGLTVAGIVLAAGCLVICEEPWWSADLPLSGALPALVATPGFALAWWSWRRRRLQQAATWLFAALFVFSILASWPRGSFSPTWYLQPFLALLATIGLGVVPGLSLTLASVVSMLLAGMMPSDLPAPAMTDLWVHVTSLAGLTLASALAGAITNRVVYLALSTAESQRRKNYEKSRALRYREKLLRHALRVDTVGDIAGMICHQLRNSFQVLIGHVTMAEMADDEERKRRLVLIEDALKGTKPLLDQLMRMAHPDEGATTSSDLTEVVRLFGEQASILLPSGICFECEVPAEPAFVMMNPEGLGHALWNLVINARQAMPSGGRIAIRCEARRHQVRIEVSDDGPGIPAEVRDRIFDPYFTTKPPGQGTGLGLTAVARFVRASNGAIQVESGPEGGTTFRLSFPRSLGTATTARPVADRSGVA